MVSEFDLRLADGSTLHIYDTGAPALHSQPLTLFWHHGTPNIGTPPRPLWQTSTRLNLRWVSFDRPGYGSSSPCPGRNIAAAANYVSQIADALDIRQFAVIGHSGGGSHALACACLPPDRVLAVVSVAGLAPRSAENLDWFAGMLPAGAAKLHAAANGREPLELFMQSDTYDPEVFTPADHAALSGKWAWFGEVVGPAVRSGLEGHIEDEMAYVAPWGIEPSQITAPVLLLHGDQDRTVPSSHAEWLSRHCPAAALRLCIGEGHISVLNHGESALEWIWKHAP